MNDHPRRTTRMTVDEVLGRLSRPWASDENRDQYAQDLVSLKPSSVNEIVEMVVADAGVVLRRVDGRLVYTRDHRPNGTNGTKRTIRTNNVPGAPLNPRPETVTT